ncbi:hypothetical protein WMY93_002811 [Mugilogobius chulae]|uniref:Calpain catalytic domain-containing protein n=1 Tax=Mugilogobius chulae TaxID=88201 RepID=A0AAW0Q373_9GOBI
MSGSALEPGPDRPSVLRKSVSLSSDTSLPQEDDVESVCSDELLGSQSRRWLTDLLNAVTPVDITGDPDTVGRDGLFVDYHFPLGELEMHSGVKWKRPKELCPAPQFIVNGASRLDISQGKLNDCWLLSAIASLSVHHELFQKVVPSDQDFQQHYTGCFTFKFWQYGEWVEVQVDDLLPTHNNRLIYLSSPEKNEFWSSLLEKAYAKLKGGYRALDMGFPHEAMVDMTGGVAEVLSIDRLPRDLFSFIRSLLMKGALINCANCQGPLEQKNPLGIMFRHAYSLTAIEKVMTSYGPVDLVRLLNPWGNTEWEGPWSDSKSPEWSTVSPQEQQRLGRVNREDGEFWMSVADFRQNFELMEVCHLTEPPTQSAFSVKPWCCVMYHGNWVPRISAGGPAHSALFFQNPQFQLELSVVDPSLGNTCSFVLSLMQKHQRRKGISVSSALHVYKAHPQNTYLSHSDLSSTRPLLCSPQYSSRREVVLRNSLPPGCYIIIPATAEANQQGAFLLRVLTEQGNAASPASKPPQDISLLKEPSYPHQAALPSPKSTRRLFEKHSDQKGYCKPVHLYKLLKEAIQGGVLNGSEKYLALEQCKSLVVLMDTQGIAKLNWPEFESLWDKIKRCGGDELVMQLVGLRYTEPDLTISYPGFLYVLMKLERMIHKFQAYDMVGMGAITVSYRQWLQMTMYN